MERLSPGCVGTEAGEESPTLLTSSLWELEGPAKRHFLRTPLRPRPSTDIGEPGFPTIRATAEGALPVGSQEQGRPTGDTSTRKHPAFPPPPKQHFLNWQETRECGVCAQRGKEIGFQLIHFSSRLGLH